jgi:hypothetical protein
MDDANSKSLRERLDALLRRAREISAEIERRVDEVTAEPSGDPQVESEGTAAAGAKAASPESPPAEHPHLEAAQEALSVAAEAVAVTAEAAAVTAEALSTIASENAGGAPPVPEAPPDAPTTVIPEAAMAVATDAKDAGRTDEKGANDSARGASPAVPRPSPADTPDESEP